MQGLWIINETPVSAGVLADYREANLRLPLSALPQRQSSRLAVIGSGPSLRKHFHEIADFEGDLWAINGAWRWLHEHGIEATFFSIDPLPVVADFARGAQKIILASQCDPAVFAQCIAQGAEVVRLSREEVGGFSAIGAAVTALEIGYEETTFFGCECSFDSPKVHIDGRELDEDFIEVGVGDDKFVTRVPYYQQALGLSSFMGRYPKRFRERSGGLLEALVGCVQLEGGIRPEMPWAGNADLARGEIPLSTEALQ